MLLATPPTELDALLDLLRDRRVAVLTGAGISTESGIPDYRGPETRRRARNPIQWRQFASDEEARRRYWARALLGWRRFAHTRPAAGHLALAELERRAKARNRRRKRRQRSRQEDRDEDDSGAF